MLSWFRMRHYWSVLIAQIVLILITAFLKDNIPMTALFVFCLLGIFGSVIETIWENPLPRILALVSGIVAIVFALVHFIPGVSEYIVKWGLLISCIAYAVFVFIAIISIARHVFITDRITADRIVGSICVYMLIGMFFAFVYAAIDIVHGDALHMPFKVASIKDAQFSDFLYFSYSTLTTIGYGDVLPTRPITKMLASLEGITGSVYLAIMVARLVGMHVTQTHKRHSSD